MVDLIKHGPEEPGDLTRLWRGLWIAGFVVGVVGVVVWLVSTSSSRHPVSQPAVSPSGLPTAQADVVRRAEINTSDQLAGMAVTPTRLWIADWGAGQVLGVDRSTLRVVARVRIGGPQNGPLRLVAGAHALWVLNFSHGDLVRLNPDTGTVDGRVHIGGELSGLAYGAQHVWVSTETTTPRLVEVAPQTVRVLRSIAITPPTSAQALTASDNDVWIGRGQLGIVTLDPATLTLKHGFGVGEGQTSTVLLADTTGAWALLGGDTLQRLDGRTGSLGAPMVLPYSRDVINAATLAEDARGNVLVAGSSTSIYLTSSHTLMALPAAGSPLMVAADGQTIWTVNQTEIRQVSLRR